VLADLVRYHHEAIVRSAAVGDDFGNFTAYNDGAPHGPAFGMNRLNHGAAIFQSGWRSGDQRLTEIALLWCDNFFDQSIWWESRRQGARVTITGHGLRRRPTRTTCGARTHR